MGPLFLSLMLCPPGVAPDTRPPASDLERFPALAVAQAALKENDRFRLWLQGQAPCWSWHRAEYEAALRACDRCRGPWQLLEDAHQWETRSHLDQLRAVLGEEWYYRGFMPAAAPWWVFLEKE